MANTVVEFTPFNGGVLLQTENIYCESNILVMHVPKTYTVRVINAIASIHIPYTGLSTQVNGDTTNIYITDKSYVSDNYYFTPTESGTFTYDDLDVVSDSEFKIDKSEYNYSLYNGLYESVDDLPASEVVDGDYPTITQDVTIVINSVVERVDTVDILNAQNETVDLRPIILCKLFYNFDFDSCVTFSKGIEGTDGTITSWTDLQVVDFVQTMSNTYPTDISYKPVNGAYFVISDFLLTGSPTQQYFTAGTYKMTLYLHYSTTDSVPVNKVGEVLTFKINNI